MIPNIFHFMWYYEGERKFGLTDYLAVISAYNVNQPDTIYFHCDQVPTGPWWDMLGGKVRIVQGALNPLKFIKNKHHQCDLERLRILHSGGGIYMDMDSICVRPLTELLDSNVVLAKCRNVPGVGSGVILAQPEDPFIMDWIAQYATYKPGEWNKYSVREPYNLAMSAKWNEHVTLLPHTAFYYPDWNNMDQLLESHDPSVLLQSYAFHLWDSAANVEMPEITLQYVLEHYNNFTAQAKRHLWRDPLIKPTMYLDNNWYRQGPRFGVTSKLITEVVQAVVDDSGSVSPTFAKIFHRLPEGFSSPEMCDALYRLARMLSGPILEIGSFIGRTICAMGLARGADGCCDPIFTVDCHFDTPEMHMAYMEKAMGMPPKIHDLRMRILGQGSTWLQLNENLARLNLSKLVQPLRGEFDQVTPFAEFSLIFCDVSHNVVEINRNVPRILKYAGEDTVIVFDDIGTPKLQAAVMSHLKCKKTWEAGRLFIVQLEE